jgi:hypothetical protein
VPAIQHNLDIMHAEDGPPITQRTSGLERKSQLLAQLQQDPGPDEREQVERLLEQINAALDSLEEAGSGTSD